MSDHDNECDRCGEIYDCPDEADHSKYCNECAHEIVEDLELRISVAVKAYNSGEYTQLHYDMYRFLTMPMPELHAFLVSHPEYEPE